MHAYQNNSCIVQSNYDFIDHSSTYKSLLKALCMQLRVFLVAATPHFLAHDQIHCMVTCECTYVKSIVLMQKRSVLVSWSRRSTTLRMHMRSSIVQYTLIIKDLNLFLSSSNVVRRIKICAVFFMFSHVSFLFYSCASCMLTHCAIATHVPSMARPSCLSQALF